MDIEIGNTYYCPHSRDPRSICIIGLWESDAFKVKYSEDDWGYRLMTRKEIEAIFYLENFQKAVQAGKLEDLA